MAAEREEIATDRLHIERQMPRALGGIDDGEDAMAAGAGCITADLVSGRSAAIDLDGLRIRRH